MGCRLARPELRDSRTELSSLSAELFSSCREHSGINPAAQGVQRAAGCSSAAPSHRSILPALR